MPQSVRRVRKFSSERETFSEGRLSLCGPGQNRPNFNREFTGMSRSNYSDSRLFAFIRG